MDGDASAPAEETPSGAPGGRWHAATQINPPAERRFASTAPIVREPPAAPPEPEPEPEPVEPEPAPVEPEPESVESEAVESESVESVPRDPAPVASETDEEPEPEPEAPRLFAPPAPEPQPIASVEAAPTTAPVVPVRPHRRRALLVIATIVAALLLVGIGVVIGLAARQNAVDDARDQASAAQQQMRAAQANATSQAGQVSSLRNELRARDAQISALQQQLEQSPGSGSSTTVPSGAEVARSFGNGLFAVGTDIEAGRYRTEGAPACYWAKLSGSNTNMVLVDHLGDGPQTVTIDSPFFVSDSCGTWTKVG